PCALHTQHAVGLDALGARGIESPAHTGKVGSGVPEGDVLRDRAAHQPRRLPGPGEPVGRCELGDVPSAPGRRARGVRRPAEGGEQTRLPGAARPLDQGHRPGLRDERHRRKVSHPQPLDHEFPSRLHDVGPAAGRVHGVRSCIRAGVVRAHAAPVPVTRRIQHVEHIFRGCDALGRGVELHAHLTDGEERLGGEQQHEETDLQAQVARQQPEPDRDRDERDRERRQQLHREPRQEREPQHLHGLAAVLVGGQLDAVGCPTVPAEQPQRRQPLHRVGETGGEVLQRLPLLLLHRAGRDPDEDEEERDERQGDDGGESARPVLPPHDRDEHRRRDDGEHELRDVPREVRVQGFQAVTGGDGDLRLIPLREPPGAEASDGRHERGPQLHPGAGGGLRARGVGGGDEQTPKESGPEQPDQGHGDVAPRDRPDDRLGEKPREGDRHRGLEDADRGRRQEEPPGGGRVSEQPRIDGFHACAGAPSIDRRVTRLRNTQ
ncbi:unnamed protein product, partial [Penicillium discolor]